MLEIGLCIIIEIRLGVGDIDKILFIFYIMIFIYVYLKIHCSLETVITDKIPKQECDCLANPAIKPSHGCKNHINIAIEQFCTTICNIAQNSLINTVTSGIGAMIRTPWQNL